MSANGYREADLYGPVKRLLEGQGFEVKGEVGDADVMAVRGDEEPVIVELKTGFSLTLFHQGTRRQDLSEKVYLAVPLGPGKAFAKSLKANKNLCRRLGLGLITVRLRDGFVQIHCDPGPYRPRQQKQKKTRLLREFARRVGDPNTGGSTRSGLMTAYRQDALHCVKHLHDHGPTKAAMVACATGVENARRIMADDHYGWFERISTGIYALSPKGRQACVDYSRDITLL
jgi:hypothetical protein